MTWSVEIKELCKGYSSEKKEDLSFREKVTNLIKNPKNLFLKKAPLFWALQDINLQIKQKQIVGIIGENGSGKSTLLKILSKVTLPTKGQVTFYGKVASLLEVRAGFHPELSGKENIFLAGTILGMRKEAIQKKFEEIVSFSELGPFLSLPVKKYSSGMFVKLGFSVMAHLDADILLLDEIFSVVDASFLEKSLQKLKELALSKTLFFVSQDLQLVQSLCHSLIKLDKGKLLYHVPICQKQLPVLKRLF